MKLEIRKRKDSYLKKLIKTDSNGNALEGTPLYVKLEEAEGNVVEEGTPITDEIIEKINWRDEESIEFVDRQDDTLPTAKNGVVQIVSKANGELWCIPALGKKDAYPIGNANYEDFVKKNITNFLESGFRLNSKKGEVWIAGKRTKIGAIPIHENDEFSFTEGTYLDINSTGNIAVNIDNKLQYQFAKNKLYLENQGSYIDIDGEGKIAIRADGNKSDLFLSGKRFSLSNDTTKVEVAHNKGNLKFNCFTDLIEASYGNANFRIQFYDTYIRLKNISTGKIMMEFLSNGGLMMNNCVFTTELIDGKYAYVITGTLYQNGQAKVIDEKTIQNYINKNIIDSYITQYFQQNFEKEYLKCFTKFEGKKLLYSGCEKTPTILVNDSTKSYQIIFSEEANSITKSIIFHGNEVASDKAVLEDGSKKYKVTQVLSNDDTEDDYLTLHIIESNQLVGYAYIHAIYEL